MIRIIYLPIRCIASLLSFLFYYLEIIADILFYKRSSSEYVRKGKCAMCGKCCRLLALEAPDLLLKNNFLRKLLIFYHKTFFNFNFLGIKNKWLVYSCGYFNNEKNKCSIYYFRHRLCRLYPRQALFGHPKLGYDCGFKFVRRDGKPGFDEILKEKINSI